MEILIRAIGIWACVMAVVVVIWTWLNPVPKVGNVKTPGLAIEFVDSDKDLGEIIGEGAAATGQWRDVREALLRGLKFDSYFFVPAYSLLFFLIALLLALRGSWALPLALAAIVCAFLAAYFDYRENERLEQVIQAGTLAANVHWAGVRKWAFSFVTVALLAPAFIPANWRTPALSVALCLLVLLSLAIAVIGGIGVMRGQYPTIAQAFTLMMLLIITFALGFTFLAGRVAGALQSRSAQTPQLPAASDAARRSTSGGHVTGG